MAYPNPTTYTLVFGEKIRVHSRARFVLVRSRGESTFVVKRSAKFATVFAEYNTVGGDCTDYIIDQAKGTCMLGFNGRHEVHDAFGKKTFELTTVPYRSTLAEIESALTSQETQS
jgi:hypothetical protein